MLPDITIRLSHWSAQKIKTGLIIGLLFTQQTAAAHRADKIPVQPLDISLDAVLTKRGLYRC